MCPNCLEDIILYNGGWYLASEGSPTQQILTLFEDYVSEKLSTATRNVVWDIRKGTAKYRRELGFAKQLLEQCDMDIEIAKEVLHEAFYGNRFAWKNRQSLKSILGDAGIIIAIVRAKKKEEEEQQRREKKALEQVMTREDIFDD
jgi:hypothetical protein